MGKKHKPAREVAQDRGGGEFWLDHAEISDEDIEWLAPAERITLWNVLVPVGFLARLRRLWWLDLRGGTARDLDVATGCKHLRYLQVNQLRGMQDLSLLPDLASLELLSLYGLAKVTEVPSLRPLNKLLRLEIGQMRGLPSLAGLLDAPELRELLVVKRVGITEGDVARINKHRSLEQFEWDALDVPLKVSRPVLDQIDLPPARFVEAVDWFKAQDQAGQ